LERRQRHRRSTGAGWSFAEALRNAFAFAKPLVHRYPAQAGGPTPMARAFAVATFILLAVVWLAAATCGNLTMAEAADQRTEMAIFAGGCFWCMEPPFDELDGVISTMSGYTGGDLANPTYEQVSAGGTGHAEAVRVVYDPNTISYAQLLDVFWRNVDPIDASGQFCDRGDQYRSAIFYETDDQKRLAEQSRSELEGQHRFDKPIATEIVAASEFFPAEEYHQDYYLKNPIRYKFYRYNCGRDQRLARIWGNASGRAAH
jgi:peptide-methionine (S)-S-oxide reductase